MWYILLLLAVVVAADTAGGNWCQQHTTTPEDKTSITVPEDKNELDFILATKEASANVTIAVETEEGLQAGPVTVSICDGSNSKSQLTQPLGRENAKLRVGKCAGGEEIQSYTKDRVTRLLLTSSAPVTWMPRNAFCGGAEPPQGGDDGAAKEARPVAEDGAEGARPVAEDGAAEGARPVAEDGAEGARPVAEDGAEGARPVAEDGADEGTFQPVVAVAWVAGCLLLVSLLANLLLGLRLCRCKKQLAAAESLRVVSSYSGRELDLAWEEQCHHPQQEEQLVFRQKGHTPPHWSSRLPSAYESENSLYGYPITTKD